jgi:GTP-binding protein Era
MPLRLHAAEITREKLFLVLHQELPYALTVETDDWRELDDGSIRIEQIIYLQRDSHKGIVLGKGGSKIKQIREKAQKEIEALAGARVHLFLFVKVRRGWVDDPERYRPWGLPFEV